MSKNRELPDEKPETQEDIPQICFAAPEAAVKASDHSRPKTLQESFKSSYNLMHQEIYADIYRPIAANPAAKLPDWFNANPSPLKSPELSGLDAARRNPWAIPGVFDGANAKPAETAKRPEAKEKPSEERVKPGNPETPSDRKPLEPIKPAHEKQAEELPKPTEVNAGKVTRDGNTIHVEYPGAKKSRDIVLDSSGKASEIITKDGSNSMHLVRKDERWYAIVQGMELQMPGKIEANERGEVTFEMENGIYRREKPDGTSVQEKTNADGSRLSFYDKDRIEKVTRKDASSLQISEDGKHIVETLPNSNKTISWTFKDDGSFVSDGQNPQTRKNFKVDANGSASWDGPDGLKFVIRADAAMLVQGEGHAKIELDEQNRIKSIDYGKKQRSFEYFDKSNEIKKTVVKDNEKNTSNSFSREKSGSDRWSLDNGQTWTGDIKISAGGIYSYKPSGSSVTELDRDGRAYTMWPDGSVTRDTVADDGSRLSYDSEGKLRKALAADGSSAEIGENRLVISNPRSGERITWTKEASLWKSDSPKYPGNKKDLQINEKCELSFTAEDGERHALRPDGKEIINRKDGVRLELNEQKQVDRISKGDMLRTIERASDGSISRVVDQNKGGERIVLDRKTNAQIQSVDLTKDGDLQIKFKDGTSTLERSNFSRVTQDKDASPLQVVDARGNTRTFVWTGEGDNKQVQEIRDSKKTAKGELTESWTRKSGSNDFVSIGSNGKEKIRQNIQLNPDGSGDYSYKNKDGGKDKISRPGADSGDSALSESVEEARDSLLEEMRDKLPETNFKRMEEMMRNFESRMSDRAYMRKLAGVKDSETVDSEVQKTVQSTYDNLRQMVAQGDDSSFYDQKTRVKLAENFMFHAMEPTTIDQGPASNTDSTGHGTCWISSGQIWGMTQHPGAMADYLKQVALSGSVTTKNGGEKDPNPKTYTFSKGLLSFDGQKQESKWTIETATTEWREEPGMKIQIWGDRSPVSKIFDYTLPVLSGSRREGDVDGGLYSSANIVGQGPTRGTREILFMVTGDYPVDRSYANHSEGHLMNNDYYKSMMEKGTVLSYTDGHLRSQTVRKVDGNWYLIQDDQHSEKSDSIMAQITDIERWAKGDRSVEKAVSISKLDLMHKKTWTGSGDADAIGKVVPRSASKPATVNASQAQNRTYSSGSYKAGYLPALQVVYPNAN
ncbi:MAG: hypothetical protein K2X27_27465 [Candidatus Obscuribacterales bacterium]|nr:hypothetical protein [Candidatus Obscuribacterales bacterium]